MKIVKFASFVGLCLIVGLNLQAGEGPLTEERKIVMLLETVARSKAIFIRNGREYPAARAVEHLKGKYNHIRDKIHTAKQFIKYVASRSSLSGRPYQVRFPDGRVVKTADWLTAELRKLEKKAEGRRKGKR